MVLSSRFLRKIVCNKDLDVMMRMVGGMETVGMLDLKTESKGLSLL